MKNPIFLVFIFIILKNIPITLAKSNPESMISEDINAILIKCPENSVNNTCEPHLIINIHMNPSVDLNNMEDSWILDEVYDPTRRAVLKIISPYLIVVGRGEPVVMYPLQYEESIKHQEFRNETPTKDDVKDREGSPSSKANETRPSMKMKVRQEVKDVQGLPTHKTDEPRPSLNMKEPEGELLSEDDVKVVQGSSSDNTSAPNPTIKGVEDGKDVQGSPPDQNKEPDPLINMNERKNQQPTEDDAKDAQGSQSAKTDDPRPSVNMTEREDEQPTKNVMASSKTNEPNPLINMKESNDKDVQGSPSDQNNEPGPSININERENEKATDDDTKNVEDFQAPNTDEPLSSMNMKEGEDEQPTEDDDKESPDSLSNESVISMKESEQVKALQSSPSGNVNEPNPSINIKESEDDKEGQGSPSDQNNEPEPSLNMKESENDKDVQGPPSEQNNEPEPSRNMKESENDKDPQGSPSDQNNEPIPSINMKERKDKEPTEDNAKDAQESQSANTDGALPSINMKEQEDEHPTVENVVSHGLLSSTTNETININEQENADETQSIQSGESKDSPEILNLKKYDEVKDLQNINIKDHKLENPSEYVIKNCEDSPSRNESGDPSRMKRNQGLVYTSKKSVGFNIALLQKSPGQDATWVHEKPLFSQSEISTLGLIEIRDPLLKKNRIRGLCHNRIPKFNKKQDEKKSSLRSYQLYNREMNMNDRNKIKQIERHTEASVQNSNSWDKQILDTNSQNKIYQNGKERDYHQKSERYSDNTKDKEFPQFHKIQLGNQKKDILEVIKNYKPGFNTRNESHPNTVGSNSNGNYLSPRTQSLKSFPPEKEEYHNFKSLDFPQENKPVQNRFKLPYNSLFNSDNAPNERQHYRYDPRPPLNVPTDLNDRKDEHYNAKTAENEINTGNNPPEERTPEHDRKNEYYNMKAAEYNINTGNELSQEKSPEQDIKNKYYNAKTADQAEEKVSEHDRNDKHYVTTTENSIYKENYLPQERFSELQLKNEYYNTKTTENIPQEKIPEHETRNEHYNAKTAEYNIYTENQSEEGAPEHERTNEYNAKTAETKFCNLPEERVPEQDIRNEYYAAKTAENISKGYYLPEERVIEHDRKGVKTNENNIYKQSGLPQERFPEFDIKNEYYNTKTDENIYKGSDLPQERVPEHDRKNEYNKAKTDENIIYKENYLTEGSVSDHDSKDEPNNIYKENYLLQEKVPEQERNNEFNNVKGTENSIYIKNDIPQEKVPEHDITNNYYNFNKAQNNIYKENNLPQGRGSEQDIKNKYYNAKTTEQDIKNKYYNAKTTENMYNENYLSPQVPELDRKNEYNNALSNIYMKSDLPQRRDPEHDINNEYYNAKSTEHNVNKGNNLPGNDRNNEYYNANVAEKNIYKENDLPEGRGSQHYRKDEPYNAKTTENNINIENYNPQRIRELDRKNEYYNVQAEKNNNYIENNLPKGIVAEHGRKNDYYSAKTDENIYKGSDLPEERDLEHDRKGEHYIQKTEKTEKMENYFPQGIFPEYDIENKFYNPMKSDNIYKGNYLPQGRFPELDRKNEYYNVQKEKNIIYDRPQRIGSKHNNYNANYLTQGRAPGLDIKNKYSITKTTENNIYNRNDLPQVSEQDIKNLYFNARAAQNRSRLNYLSSGEREKFKFNEPMKSHSGTSNVPYSKEYNLLNANSRASSTPNYNNYMLNQTEIDFIINKHMREGLRKNNNYKNDQTYNGQNAHTIPYNIKPGDLENTYISKNAQQFDLNNFQSMPHNFNPKDLYSDLGQPYSQSKFPQRKPLSSYPRANPYRPVPRNFKRIRRSWHTRENRDANQYMKDGFSLQKIEENGEVPCDTCGGKNKKKDEKPPARFCSALIEPKSSESKLEEFNAPEKLNDVIPCDTCGGKNKKGEGKSPPGSLDSEVQMVKAESVQPLTSEDAIPCEKCKVNREGNLAAQSCGCVSNPSVCNCEVSKLSRALNQSKEDINYGVFNMNSPIPYLTTQLRVFRRRHNTWWRIVPIVRLDSVSGIFANKNMSMVFSTRVGTLRQEKSARFSDHKLFIPLKSDGQLAETRSLETLTELQNNIGKSFLIGSSRKDLATREIKDFEEDAIKGIDSLGYFPVTMKALQMCPHNDKNICLNIRGERVPEFSIKVKIPFRENAFMVKKRHVVKIFSIVTDATTKDAIQISIDVINKGLEAHEYSIYVYNCPLSKSALSTTSIRRQLLPDIGQNVTFLLPFINSAKKNKKFTCDVVVKESDLNNSNKSFFLKSSDIKAGIIAKRTMDIKVHSRCFCIGRCRCHCMEKLQTFVNYNICERMSRRAQEDAGLIYNCPPGNERNDVCITDLSCDSRKKTSFNIFYKIQTVILILFIWLLIFGLLKAIFGLCIRSIDQYGFETVQPGRYYACSSRIRIFIVNVFFFIIYPLTCWCKCFKPKPEDLMAASTDWSCNHEVDDDDCSLGEHKDSEKRSRLCGGGPAQKLSEDLLLAFAPHYENGLFKDDKPDDEESTLFILEVLEESKTSLSKMMSQSTKSSDSPEMVSKCAENSEEERTAEELVENLKTSQRAYRLMSSPVGGVINIPENSQYCVKGFFLPTIKGTYEFFSYHPLVQYIGFSKENEVMKLMKPQYLRTDEFSRTYANKLEVLKAGDLSVGCPPNIPCVNITPSSDLENSFLKLSELLKETRSE
ncbi:uncharacterized protein [Drosophila kikkawai]|uniref:Uncharacterized protein isoform X2 n=1 Tax=Drosophila kikkawai TaxID=30033 RepID=A0ABM4GIK6_DROKI